MCVPMARAGLLLVLSELIRPGHKVLMSPFTIADVVNAVLFAGDGKLWVFGPETLLKN